MTIKRYNQSGVGTALQFGRRGGQLEWDGGAFSFTDSAGAPATLKASDIVGGVSEIVTKNDLDRAVQGLNIKKSVKAYDTIPDAIADVPAYIADPTNFASYAIGDRILLVTVAGTPSPANGIYEIADVSGNNLPVRPLDAIDYATIEGAYMYVDGVGATDESAEGTGWVLNIVDDTQAGQAAYDFNQGVLDELISIDVKQFHGAGTVKGGYGISVTGDIIALDAGAITDVTEAISDASDQDLLMVNTSGDVRRVNHKKLINDLGIYKDLIGSGNSQFQVIQDATGDTATYTLKLEVDTVVNTLQTINKDGYAWTGIADSGFAVTAGDGTGANAGGQIDITAGAAEAAGGGTGGRIVLTPGEGDGTTAAGYVEIGGTYGLQLPSSDGAAAHDGTTGMIRVKRDTTNGIDNLELWDSQLAEWTKIGGGSEVKDLDGDTYISVETSVGADNDTIAVVADGSTVANIAKDSFSVATENNATNSGDISLVAGSRADSLGTTVGAASGSVTIEAGAIGTGDALADAGNVNITTRGGSINLSTVETNSVVGLLTLDSPSIKIGDTTGNTSSTIEIGSSDTFSTNVTTKSFGVTANGGATGITMETDAIFRTEAGMGFQMYDTSTNGTASSIIGKNDSTFQFTNFKTISLNANANSFGGFNVNAQTSSLYMNEFVGFQVALDGDGNAAPFRVSRSAPNTTGGNARNVTLVTKTDDDSFFTLTATGDASAAGSTPAEQYAQNIRDAAEADRMQAIPNVAYISEAVQNAELGGIATRSLTVEDGQTGGTSGATTFAFDKDVPSNTRIRRVTVSVTEAFVGVAELEGTISGGSISLFDQDDVDITSVGTYIIEHAGTQTVSGTFSLVFDGDVETVATAGAVTVYVEFTI